MGTASDAKNLAEDLKSSIAVTHLYAATLENKLLVLQSEGTDTASLQADLRAIKAARLSLLARIDLLRNALHALVPTLRPLKFEAPAGPLDLNYRIVNEGARPQWSAENSTDPEGLYTWNTADPSAGLQMKWAKVTPAAPDLEHVFFGTSIPWLLWPVADLSVTADVEYEYEFWVETPDGRRSDIDVERSGDDGQPIPIETRSAKIKVLNTATPPPPSGYLTAPSTLRRAQGVYIGSAINDITSRLDGYYGASKLNISAPGSLGWYHQYISAGQGWDLWQQTATGWLEAMKPHIKSTTRTDPGIKFYFNIPPFPETIPMNSGDPGWTTLTSKGYTTDPLSWAAAKDGAYNWYYEWLGKELARIYGVDSNKIVLCYSWEENGNWYHFRIVNSDKTRNTTLETNCKEATRQFADSVNRQLHPSGWRTHICRNVAGGALSLTGRADIQGPWEGWKNSVPLDTSAVTGRPYIDVLTFDTYQNWDQKDANDTSIALASANVFATWVEANLPWCPYGIQETSTSWVFRRAAVQATTTSGSKSFTGVSTTWPLVNAASLAASGYIEVGGRTYKYTSKTGNTLNGVTYPSTYGNHTVATGAGVRQKNIQGAGDDGGDAWWEMITDWAEGKRAAGKLVMLIAFDSDNSATDQFGILEHKSYSPTWYWYDPAPPTGFVGNGTGESAAKYIAEFGGSRSTATT